MTPDEILLISSLKETLDEIRKEFQKSIEKVEKRLEKLEKPKKRNLTQLEIVSRKMK